MVPAVNAVFDDPCPRVYKTLQFGFRCQPEVDRWACRAPLALSAPAYTWCYICCISGLGVCIEAAAASAEAQT